MTKLFISRFTVALIAIFALSTSAFAQKIIVIDSAEVMSKSQVGQHIERQLKSIQSQMTSELKSMASQVESAQSSLNAQMKGKSQAEQQTMMQSRPDLQKQYVDVLTQQQKLKNETQIKSREIIMTRDKAFKSVGERMKNIIQSVAVEKGADVIMDRSSTIYINPTIDMTQTVISRLNSQMPTTPVNRERLPRK